MICHSQAKLKLLHKPGSSGWNTTLCHSLFIHFPSVSCLLLDASFSRDMVRLVSLLWSFNAILIQMLFEIVLVIKSVLTVFMLFFFVWLFVWGEWCSEATIDTKYSYQISCVNVWLWGLFAGARTVSKGRAGSEWSALCWQSRLHR